MNGLVFLTDALGAEIQVLEKRKSDDPFIKGLRELQEGIDVLKTIHVDIELIRPVRIDSPAVRPESPIKPKKLLILTAGTLLGVMLGLFVALVIPARKADNI